MIRYEQLQANPTGELARAARLLEVDPTPEVLRRAVELSSADRMRQMEQDQGRKWVQTKYTRQDKPFVRKGSSGNWKSVLPAESVALIEAIWGHLMIRLGYELSAPARSAQPATTTPVGS